MSLPKARILVVDDERNVLLTVEAILRQEGYAVDTVADGNAAIEAIRTRDYDLVLTDLKMPGADGLAVLAEVRKLSPQFDEFAQLERRHGRQREGSGLGLAIVKRITEAHQGTIAVNSAPGKGSTFSVVLPMRAVQVPSRIAVPP